MVEKLWEAMQFGFFYSRLMSSHAQVSAGSNIWWKMQFWEEPFAKQWVSSFFFCCKIHCLCLKRHLADVLSLLLWRWWRFYAWAKDLKTFFGRNMSLPSIAVSIEVSRNFIYCLGFLTISELWRKCLLTFGNLAQHFQLEKSFQNSECVARI